MFGEIGPGGGRRGRKWKSWVEALGNRVERRSAGGGSSMPLDSERVKHEYFHLATQYYTAARYSARAALTPVCGNLFHHAVELYVKGAPSEHVSTEEMKDPL